MAGIWTIDGDSLVTVERFDVGPAVVLVPTEQLLLLSVELPIANPRRRLAALPFAIEDRIAVPLAETHSALGREMAPRVHLAAVVARPVMARWAALLGDQGLDHAILAPDVLGLPVPPVGAWSVDVARTRALVRAADGTGFAVPGAHFHAAWVAGGRPRLLSYGEALAADYAAEPADHEPDALARRLGQPDLDLRQGDFAAPRRTASPLWKRIAIIAAAGAAAHAAIAAADTLALDHIAATKAAETRALVQQAAPSATLGSDLAASVADLLPAGGPGPSAFLPLFGRVATALKPMGATVRMRSVSFDGAAGTLAVELEAPDLAVLQQAGTALSGAGLSAQPGAASQTEGKAVGAFIVKGTA